jgi:enamine deaminase RidA (YjgF/YER057c/UK114 family)
MAIAERLRALGLVLPPAPAPAANYVPFVRQGRLLFVAGQGPVDAQGRLCHLGRVGETLSEQEGYQAARLTALTCLAQAQAALGSLDRIRRILHLRGYVCCVPEFTGHPRVLDGASDVLVEIFGQAGQHARLAVGMPTLPFHTPVEIELLAAVE